MGKHWVYKLRKIPEMVTERYHYFLGLQDGADQLLNIVDKCTTSDQMETVFRYLEERIKLADFYVAQWAALVRADYDNANFGEGHEVSCERLDHWENELHTLSQVRNFMIEVCGVDRYGEWIKENHDDQG